jgi:hypothetical protein
MPVLSGVHTFYPPVLQLVSSRQPGFLARKALERPLADLGNLLLPFSFSRITDPALLNKLTDGRGETGLVIVIREKEKGRRRFPRSARGDPRVHSSQSRMPMTLGWVGWKIYCQKGERDESAA